MDNTFLSLLGSGVAALLTLMVFSYLLRDNSLFRIGLYLLVGLSAGYAAAIAIADVIFPQLIQPALAQLSGNPEIQSGELLIRVALSLLLLSKLWSRSAAIGNPVGAFLVGVGAALAIAGAVQGTLVPQIGAASNFSNIRILRLALNGGYFLEAGGLLLQGFIVLGATLGTMAFFHFSASRKSKNQAERPLLLERLAGFGKIIIPISLASLFTGVLLSSLSIFVERVMSLVEFVTSFTPGL